MRAKTTLTIHILTPTESKFSTNILATGDEPQGAEGSWAEGGEAEVEVIL